MIVLLTVACIGQAIALVACVFRLRDIEAQRDQYRSNAERYWKAYFAARKFVQRSCQESLEELKRAVHVFAALLFVALPCLGGEARLPLVDRIQPFEESTGDSEAIGDDGKARGLWQMTEAAWCEVSAILERQGLPTWDWETGAHLPDVARDYAATYLSIIRADLRRAMKREPSEKEIWAAWNMGVDGFRRCGFKLNNCPASTRRKAERL